MVIFTHEIGVVLLRPPYSPYKYFPGHDILCVPPSTTGLRTTKMGMASPALESIAANVTVSQLASVQSNDARDGVGRVMHISPALVTRLRPSGIGDSSSASGRRCDIDEMMRRGEQKKMKTKKFMAKYKIEVDAREPNHGVDDGDERQRVLK